MEKKPFQVGDKVTYTKTQEKGIVSQVNLLTCHVVYNCGEDWENYAYYTGIMTKNEDLIHGWKNTINNAENS